MFAKFLAVLAVLVFATAIPAMTISSFQTPQCLCCGDQCTCIDCGCDENSCACDTGGDCFCSETCAACLCDRSV